MQLIIPFSISLIAALLTLFGNFHPQACFYIWIASIAIAFITLGNSIFRKEKIDERSTKIAFVIAAISVVAMMAIMFKKVPEKLPVTAKAPPVVTAKMHDAIDHAVEVALGETKGHPQKSNLKEFSEPKVISTSKYSLAVVVAPKDETETASTWRRLGNVLRTSDLSEDNPSKNVPDKLMEIILSFHKSGVESNERLLFLIVDKKTREYVSHGVVSSKEATNENNTTKQELKQEPKQETKQEVAPKANPTTVKAAPPKVTAEADKNAKTPPLPKPKVVLKAPSNN